MEYSKLEDLLSGSTAAELRAPLKILACESRDI